MRSIVWVVSGTLALVGTSSGQSAPSRTGRRELMARDAEIALARSAAPASVSAGATVMVLTDTGFVVAATGNNGVTCIVNRSWPRSLEPHCFDEEGSQSVLGIEMRRTLLFHQGRGERDVDSTIAAELRTGKLHLPRRPAMSYMMSSRQELIGDDGVPAGRWRPHVMIYYPYLTNRDAGFAPTPDMTVGMVADEGTPMSSIMVIMPGFAGSDH